MKYIGQRYKQLALNAWRRKFLLISTQVAILKNRNSLTEA